MYTVSSRCQAAASFGGRRRWRARVYPEFLCAVGSRSSVGGDALLFAGPLIPAAWPPVAPVDEGRLLDSCQEPFELRLATSPPCRFFFSFFLFFFWNAAVLLHSVADGPRRRLLAILQ